MKTTEKHHLARAPSGRGAENPTAKAAYVAPRLERVGEVAAITMGSVGPFLESGGGFRTTPG